jgi:hypothetical protein
VYDRTSSFLIFPHEIGVLIGAPVSGALYGGQLALGGSAWMEWKMFRTLGSRIGFRLEGDHNLSWWNSPSQTRVSDWSFWGALLLHFGSTG